MMGEVYHARRGVGTKTDGARGPYLITFGLVVAKFLAIEKALKFALALK